MTRAERYAQIKALRDRGLLLREIGEELGLAVSTVHDVLVDPSGDKARARKERYRTPCVDCGRLTNPNGKQLTERCVPCTQEREKAMSRKWVLDSIREWADIHGGVPPTATDWNPSHARVAGQEWRVERMEATGRPWPSVSLAQQRFGSWNAALAEAGFEPFPSGCYGREGEDLEVCAELRRRYEAGESAYALAQEVGLSQTGVTYRIQKAGGRLRSLEEANRLRRQRAA